MMKKTVPLILAGVAYYLAVVLLKVKIPCIWRTLTGFKCPACGITSMMVDVSRLNFHKAFWDNPYLAIMLPVSAAVIIFGRGFIEKYKRIIVPILIVTTVSWGVLRNVFEL